VGAVVRWAAAVGVLDLQAAVAHGAAAVGVLVLLAAVAQGAAAVGVLVLQAAVAHGAAAVGVLVLQAAVGSVVRWAAAVGVPRPEQQGHPLRPKRCHRHRQPAVVPLQVATAVAARLHLVLLAVAVRLLLAAVAAVAFLCRNIGALWQRLGKRLCTLLFAIELLLKYELDLQKEECFQENFPSDGCGRSEEQSRCDSLSIFAWRAEPLLSVVHLLCSFPQPDWPTQIKAADSSCTAEFLKP
jgi:hypothetical protein